MSIKWKENILTPKALQAVLDDHLQWLRDPSTGKRANLSRANLSRANLYSADLSGANLYSANLSSANLPCPIYQFFLGKFNAVATPTELRIGCEVHPWETWLNEEQRKKIADSAKFTEQEYEAHSRTIKLFHELLVSKRETT